MKLLIFSDLHLEFPQQMRTNTLPPIPDNQEFDVVIAAGDIGYGMEAVKRLESLFPSHPVLFVPGNHEYYKSMYGAVKKQYDDYDGPVNILNPDRIDIDGYTFIGATMWSDCILEGYDYRPNMISDGIADFRLISGFSVYDMMEIHQQELMYVERELSNQSNEKTVVITHFVPSQHCVHPRWKGAWLNPYFTNDHDYLTGTHKYPIHVFGHTHDRYDLAHPEHNTRMIGNPRGYPNENPEPFNWKIVEI